MTRQAQKNEEMLFAEKAGELLDETWIIEESPNEKHWPDLIVSTSDKKFGLEVRNIFKDESESGSCLKNQESIRVSQLKALSESYYDISDIPITLQIAGDIRKDEIDNAASYLKEKAGEIEEKENIRLELPGSKTIAYLTRLPMSFGCYNRWQNVSNYVSWGGFFLTEEYLKNIIAEKESKLSKYQSNIADVKLLLILNKRTNSGRAEFPEGFCEIKSGFSEIYIMLHPDIIYRVNCT